MKWRILGTIISISIITYMLIMIILTSFVFKDESANLEAYSSGLIEDNPNLTSAASNSLTSENSSLEKKKNTSAPDFELTTLSGDIVKLSDYKGKKVLLNFWASWCKPCEEEMPHIQKFYEEKAKESNIEVITVNMTKYERTDLRDVKNFVKDHGLTFPVLLDKEGEIMDLYEIKFFPTTYILDTEGVIVEAISSPLSYKQIDKLVNKEK